MERIFWHYAGDVYGDVAVMTSLKWRHSWFLKFDFVMISLKNQNLVKSCNFRLPISKV